MKSKLTKLLLINTFVLLFFNFAHPVTPNMLQDKNISATYNGILYALMSLGMVVGSPFWAKKVQNTNSNKIIALCLVGYGVAQLFFGFSQYIIVMCISRLLSGIFAGGWIVLSTEYINQHTEDDNKLKYFAYLLVSNSLAGILGQLLSGELGQVIGIYYIFILQALGLLLIIPFINKTLDRIKVHKKTEQNKKEGKLGLNLIIIMILIMLFSTAYTAYNSQIGYYISDVLNGTTLNVAQINSYTNVITLIVNIYLINLISKCLKQKQIITVQILISLLGILTIMFLSTFVLLGVTLFLLGIVSYKPNIQKYAVSQDPSKSVMIIAYLNSFNAIGMVLGSVLSGVLYSYNPIYIMYFILINLLLVLVIQIVSIKTRLK